SRLHQTINPFRGGQRVSSQQFCAAPRQKPKRNRPADLPQGVTRPERVEAVCPELVESAVILQSKPQLIARQSNTACSIPARQWNEQRENRRMHVHVLMAIDVRESQTGFSEARKLRLEFRGNLLASAGIEEISDAKPRRRIWKSTLIIGQLR